MSWSGTVTLRRIETVDPQTGEVTVSQGYSAPVRVTVAGALPRTDLGVHPVAEDNLDGHDTAMKGAVTDGLKRAFRSFGVQFGNGFYGDQPQAGSTARPERVPAQINGRSGQTQATRRADSQAETLRKRLIEIAIEQGFDEDGVRSAVMDRTGKSIDDLAAGRAGTPGRGRRQQAPADAAGPGRLVRRTVRHRAGFVSFAGRPRSFIYRTTKEG